MKTVTTNLPIRLISTDAETNGLWGKPFQVAMVVVDNGNEVDRINFRCPIKGEIDPWVQSDVLPQLEGMENTHESLDSMLKDVAEFWLKYKNDAEMLVHMGFVVEAYLFRLMHQKGFIGPWDAPYKYVEVAELLRCNGDNYDSVDTYMTDHTLPKPDCVGGTHNALYDCLVASAVYFDLIK